MEYINKLERELLNLGVIFDNSDDIKYADSTEIDYEPSRSRNKIYSVSNDWEGISTKITSNCFVFSRKIDNYRSFIEPKFERKGENWSSHFEDILSDIKKSTNIQAFGDFFLKKSIKKDEMRLTPVVNNIGQDYLFVQAGNHRIAFLCWIGYQFNKKSLLKLLND